MFARLDHSLEKPLNELIKKRCERQKCRATFRLLVALGIHPASRGYTVCSFSTIEKMRVAMNQPTNMLVALRRVWALLLAAIVAAGCGTAPAPTAAPTSAAAAPTSVPTATAVPAPTSGIPTQGGAPASKPQPVTLAFAFPDDAASSAAAMAQIAAYTSDHPQVQVTAKPLPAADYARKLLDSVTTNTNDIDLFVSTDSLVPALINRRAALDLQALLAGQSAFKI